MKKILSIAVSGLLAFSCANSPIDMETAVKPADQAETVAKGVKADIVLYGTVADDVETKVAASEEGGYLKFQFEENDAISTFLVSGDNKDVNVKFTYDKDGKFVPDGNRLYTTLGGEMPDVYGIYPYESGLSSVTDPTKVPVTISQVQMYDPDQYTSNPKFPKDYARFAAVPGNLVKEDDGSYSIGTAFYSMGSMIKFQIQNGTGEELSIRSVNIYGASNLSGDFTADLTADPSFGNDEYKLTPATDGTRYNHVCVSFGNEGYNLAAAKRMPLYAFVNAVNFDSKSDGFSMTVSTDKGTYKADFKNVKSDGFARNARHNYTVTLNSDRLIDRLIGSEYVARYSNDGGKTWTNVKSLRLAISNITTGQSKDLGIVELLQDAVHGAAGALVCNGKKFTINGNGYSYDISNRTGHAFSIGGTDESDVTFRDIKIFSNETKDSPSSRYLAYNFNSNSRIAFAEGTEINGIYYNGTNGGVVYNKGRLDINGARISNCGVRKTSDDKGGLGGFVFSTGEGAVVNLNGGEISNCSAEANGGAICNYTSSTVNINWGEISNCSAGNYGGAIYNSSGILNMNGGYISNCSASSGSAIFTTGEVNMVGGEISSSSGTTGAIYGNSYTTKITIGRENDPSSCPVINNTTGRGIYSYGITKVYGGKITTYGVAVYSLSGKNGDAELNIYDGSLESTNNVVYIKNSDNYTTNAEISGGKFKYSGANNLAVVYSDDANLTVDGGYFSKEVKSEYLAEGYGCLKTDKDEDYPYEVLVPVTFQQEGGEVQNKASLEDAVDAANIATANCTIKLLENYTVVSKKDITNEGIAVTLDLNGKTLTQAGTGRVGVASSGHLTIIDNSSDNSGVVQQKKDVSAESYTFSLTSGTLDIKGGTIMQNADKGTSTIYVNGATLNVSENAKIVGDKGTALSINSGTIKIDKGEISSASSRCINATGGNVIVNNGTFSSKVYTIGSTGASDITINNGVFNNTNTNPSQVYYGSNIYATDGNITIKGGQFTSNRQTVYCDGDDVKITISEEPSFKNNYTGTVQAEGAVLYTSKGSIIVNGGYYYTCTTATTPRCFIKGTATISITKAYFNTDLAPGYRDTEKTKYGSLSKDHTHGSESLHYTTAVLPK